MSAGACWLAFFSALPLGRQLHLQPPAAYNGLGGLTLAKGTLQPPGTI